LDPAFLEVLFVFFFEMIQLRFCEGLAPKFFGVLFLFQTIWLHFRKDSPCISCCVVSFLKQFGFPSAKLSAYISWGVVSFLK
jgi:hypothetical protein